MNRDALRPHPLDVSELVRLGLLPGILELHEKVAPPSEEEAIRTPVATDPHAFAHMETTLAGVFADRSLDVRDLSHC